MAAATMRGSSEMTNGRSDPSNGNGARRASRKYNTASPAAADNRGREVYPVADAPTSGQSGRSFSARAQDLPAADVNYTTRKPTLGTPPAFSEESTTPRGLPPVVYPDPSATMQENEEPTPVPEAPVTSNPQTKTMQPTSGQRRNWAPDHSPLQKLEVTLNGISKEEKRARVQEAEIRLRERLARQKAEREQAEATAVMIPTDSKQSAQSQSRAEPGSTKGHGQKDAVIGDIPRDAPVSRQAAGTAVRHNRTVSMNPQYLAIRRGENAQYAQAQAAIPPSAKMGSGPQRSMSMTGPPVKQGPSDRIAHSHSVSQAIATKPVLPANTAATVPDADRIQTPPAARAAQGSADSSSKPKRERQTVSFDVPPPTPPPIFEWRNAPVARLGAPDFDFQHLDIDRGKAWWEGGGTSNRRKSRALPKNYTTPVQKVTGEMSPSIKN